jgi:hypothetical protein
MAARIALHEVGAAVEGRTNHAAKGYALTKLP